MMMKNILAFLSLAFLVVPSNTNVVPQVVPSELHFESTSFVCTTTVQTITIVNADPHRVLTVYKPKDRRKLDSSFIFAVFPTRTLNPLEQMQAEVLFLPQSQGNLRETIPIEYKFEGDVDKASLLYEVQGEAAANPYGLFPIPSLEVNVGQYLNHPIELHNPFRHTLRVTEIYTTEPFLQLTLPQGTGAIHQKTSRTFRGQAPTTLKKSQNDVKNIERTSPLVWEFEPNETREVIRLAFKSHQAGLFMAYLHVKTDDVNSVVPVRIKVRHGVHAVPERLDFRTLLPGQKRTISVTLVSTTKKTTRIQSVSTRVIDNHMSVRMKNGGVVEIKPQRKVRGAIEVTYRGYNETEVLDDSIPSNTAVSNFILCKTSHATNSPMLKIEYKALLIRGKMDFKPIHILVAPDLETREFPNELYGETYLYNAYSDPVQIRDFVASHYEYMKAVVPSGAIAQPGQMLTEPVSVKFDLKSYIKNKGNKEDPNFMFSVNAFIKMNTNITGTDIPIIMYNGGLTFGEGEERNKLPLLDFGYAELRSYRDVRFNLTNENPVPIPIEDIIFNEKNRVEMKIKLLRWFDRKGTTLNSTHHQREGYMLPFENETNVSLFLPKRQASNNTKSLLVLEPGDKLEIHVHARALEKLDRRVSVPDVIVIRSPHALLPIHVRFHTLAGTIEFAPQDVLDIFVPYDHFKFSHEVVDIVARNGFDAPVQFRDSIHTSPHTTCFSVSLSSVSTLRSGFTSKVGTLNLGHDVVHKSGNVVKAADILWLQDCEESWNSDFDETKRVSRFNVVFDTEFGFDVTRPIETRIRRLRWDVPETIDFGMFEIGKVAEIPLNLVNPARGQDAYIRVQETGDGVFSSTTPRHVLHSGERIEAKLQFRPIDRIEYEGTYYIRNNITGLQQIQVRGQGGLRQLMFLLGGKTVTNEIKFSVDKYDLIGNCTSKKTCTIRDLERKIVLRNTGDMIINIESFDLRDQSLSSSSCEGIFCWFYSSSSSKILFSSSSLYARVEREGFYVETEDDMKLPVTLKSNEEISLLIKLRAACEKTWHNNMLLTFGNLPFNMSLISSVSKDVCDTLQRIDTNSTEKSSLFYISGCFVVFCCVVLSSLYLFRHSVSDNIDYQSASSSSSVDDLKGKNMNKKKYHQHVEDEKEREEEKERRLRMMKKIEEEKTLKMKKIEQEEEEEEERRLRMMKKIEEERKLKAKKTEEEEEEEERRLRMKKVEEERRRRQEQKKKKREKEEEERKKREEEERMRKKQREEKEELKRKKKQEEEERRQKELTKKKEEEEENQTKSLVDLLLLGKKHEKQNEVTTPSFANLRLSEKKGTNHPWTSCLSTFDKTPPDRTVGSPSSTNKNNMKGWSPWERRTTVSPSHGFDLFGETHAASRNETTTTLLPQNLFEDDDETPVSSTLLQPPSLSSTTPEKKEKNIALDFINRRKSDPPHPPGFTSPVVRHSTTVRRRQSDHPPGFSLPSRRQNLVEKKDDTRFTPKKFFGQGNFFSDKDFLGGNPIGGEDDDDDDEGEVVE